MHNAILTVVAISHLATSLLLIRALDKNYRHKAVIEKQRQQIRRLITVATPPRRTKP
jgi:hypothetical protein